MRTTIANNIGVGKICIFLKMALKVLKLLFSDLKRLWQNHYGKILTIFGLGNIYSVICVAAA